MFSANFLKWLFWSPRASPYLYEPIISIPTQVITARGNGAHGGCVRNTSTCLRKNASVLAKDALNHRAQLGPNSFPHGPVDCGVLADGFHQLARNRLEGLVAQDLDCAIVHFQGVVES